jgi:hypothetical protein
MDKDEEEEFSFAYHIYYTETKLNSPSEKRLDSHLSIYQLFIWRVKPYFFNFNLTPNKKEVNIILTGKEVIKLKGRQKWARCCHPRAPA